MNSRKLIRIISIILVVLMVGGVVVSGLMAALAEENAPTGDHYTISMEYLSEEQALRISQRLVYVNRGNTAIEQAVFYAAGNMFRRENALMYESDDLEKVFPYGFAPSGLDIQSVRFNGKETDWGMQGENELYLRADCDLLPGEKGVFEFDYYLLLPLCGAFIGQGETDVRLSAFYFIPGVFDQQYHEFIMKKPLPFTRWLYSDAADYDVTLKLPENYLPAATGREELLETADGKRIWKIEAQNIREFAVSFGKRYRLHEKQTESGIIIRMFAAERNIDEALKCAVDAIEQCEEWFGKFPLEEMDIVQSDYPLGGLNYPGTLWISGELLKSGNEEALKKQIRFAVAQQYFGFSAYTEPSADAWLSDSICEYISYLLLEAEEGKNKFLKAINSDWVDSLQLTIPGGLRVTSDASLFDGYEYEVVVLNRGAVVMHELRNAMGLESMIDGLAEFYRMGQDGHTLTEIELVNALDTASGGSWEAFLTDWLFNIDKYVNQSIEWFE